MQLSFTLSDTCFYTSASVFKNTKKINIQLLDSIDINIWNINSSKISKSLKDFISIDFSKNSNLLAKLKTKNCIGFYVKINGIDGFLFPTFDKFFWGIRLWNVAPILKFQKIVPKPSQLQPQSQPQKKEKEKAPPITKESSLTSLSIPLHDIDPIQFLADRYCRTLYTQIVIDHFPKSTLPKMHLLTRNTIQLAKDTLITLAIPNLDTLDSRFLSDSNSWLIPGESNYRTKPISNLDSLKAKDIRLQIIINLELLSILKKEGKETKEEDMNPQKRKQEQKPGTHENMKNTRLRRRRLIPTLLGTALPSMPDFDTDLRQLSNTQSTTHTITTTSRLIAGLFDRLCIDDVVLGLDYRDDRSAWSFLTNVLTPFYAKTHSRLLRELAINARGPAVLLKLKSRQLKKKKSSSTSTSTSISKNKQSTQNKQTIDLSQLKLARSHSSVGTASTADLARKTFSLNDTDTTSQPIPITSPARFMNSKKRRLVVQSQSQPPPPSSSSLSPPQSQPTPPPPPSPPTPLLFRDNQIIEATPRNDRITTPTTNRQNILTSPTPKRKLTFN